MKRQDYEFSRMKHQLYTRRSRGEKAVYWKLSNSQKEYVEKLGYRTEPFLYSVHTKKFPYNSRSNECSIIKKIHSGALNGKTYVVCKLKKDERKILDAYGIHYRVEKYKILLG